MKAVKTNYKGVIYRSKLEADFAYFLDKNGLNWFYEPMNYLLSNGKHYIPDFYIPELKLWVECRGYYSKESSEKVLLFGEMINFGLIAPDMSTRDYDKYDKNDVCSYLVLLENRSAFFTYKGNDNIEDVYVSTSKNVEITLCKCIKCNASHIYAIKVPTFQCRKCGGVLDFLNEAYYFNVHKIKNRLTILSYQYKEDYSINDCSIYDLDYTMEE
jgi:hypothetical protein